MPVEQLIYTDRARGKGLDPTCVGYQIKACSPDLDVEARELLGSICTHYGQAVYANDDAMKEAKDKELAWRLKTDVLNAVPKEILDEFPVIWSYDRLRDGLFSLTRIRYCGLSHDRKFGNFFTHSWVFSPDELSCHDYNPLTLARTGLFLSEDPSDETSLPPRENLVSEVRGAVPYQILQKDPYQARLEQIVSAIAGASQEGRPVLICISDWREARPLVEALLALLPPSARCRTTVTTYENDRNWFPFARGSRPEGRVSAHHLMVLCGNGERSFSLRTHECESSYTVFNFVDGESTKPGDPSPYASRTAKRLKDRRIDLLKDQFGLLEGLGLGGHPEEWNRLAPAFALFDEDASTDELDRALKSLSDVAVESGQAKLALKAALPSVRRFAEADDRHALSTLSGKTALLSDRAAKNAGSETIEEFIAPIRNLVDKAVSKGRWQTVTRLLACCGAQADGLRFHCLKTILGGSWAPSPSGEDREELRDLANLLKDAVPLARERMDAAVPMPSLLKRIFQVAGEGGFVAEVWKDVGESVVMPFLEDTWNDEMKSLVQEIVPLLPDAELPKVKSLLCLKLLAEGDFSGEELIRALKQTVVASSRCERPKDRVEIIDKVLGITNDKFSVARDRAAALGRFAEAVRGTDAQDRLTDEFRKCLEGNDAGNQEVVFKKLAAAGVVHLVCSEFMDRMLPWSSPEGNRTLQKWWDIVLAEQPAIRKEIYVRIAGKLRPAKASEEILTFANELMIKGKNALRDEMDLTSLFDAVAAVIPLRPSVKSPMEKTWEDRLDSDHRKLGSKAKIRLALIKLIGKVENLSREENWSATEFPCNDSAWGNIQKLDPDDVAEALDWSVSLFEDSGITQPAEARALVNLMKAAQDDFAPNVMDAVDRLLRGRDETTCINAAAAFALCVLDGNEDLGAWGRIVGGIVENFGRSVRKGLEDHLEKRFGPRGPNYRDRLRLLSEKAGIRPPEPVSRPAETPEFRRPPDEKEGLVSKISRFFVKAERIFWRVPDKQDDDSDTTNPPPSPKSRGKKKRKDKKN